MNHHHHDHEHHHHDTQSELTFDEKLIKLLDHWLKHNDDHARTYLDWAKKAAQNDREEVGRILEDVGALTAQISAKFEQAGRLMNPEGS